MKQIKLKMLFALACTVLLISAVGCGGSSDSTTGGGGGGGGVVADEWEADWVASLIDNITGDIDIPTTSKSVKADSFYAVLTDYVVSGVTGSVTINGTNERDYSSSSSSVSDTHTVDVTFDFSNYSDGFNDATLTGTIDYYVYHSSYSTAYSYSDTYNKSISGSGVNIVCPSSDDEYTIDDTISFNLSDKNDNEFIIEGSVTNGNGETFYLD